MPDVVKKAQPQDSLASKGGCRILSDDMTIKTEIKLNKNYHVKAEIKMQDMCIYQVNIRIKGA